MNGLIYILLRNFQKDSHKGQLWTSQEKSENLVFEFGSKAEHLETF